MERHDHSVAYANRLMEKAIESTSNLNPAPYIARVLARDKMAPEAVQQVVPSLLLAGIDTTKSVLNWNLLYLAQNPEKQDRLRAELHDALGDARLTEAVAAKMKSKLPYLKAVVRETHRIAPASAVMTMRTAPCDLELNGYLVPEGTKVGFNIYSMQNDPRYVEDPSEFKPERWLSEAVKARVGTESEVIDNPLLGTPFSFGARMCLGGRVAELETFAFLSRIVRDWRFTTKEESPVWKTVQPLMTKPHPFPAFHIEPC